MIPHFIDEFMIHLHVNKTNIHIHMKGFELGLALKQRRKAIRKWPIPNLFSC